VPLGYALPAWHSPWPAARPSVAPEPASSAITADAIAASVPHANARPSWTWLLLLVWGIGFAGSVAVVLTGAYRVARLTRRSTVPADGRLARLTTETASQLGLSRPVDVRQMGGHDVLGTWGVWRPRVLLPAHASRWDDERAVIVLRHELAHIKRRDWLMQMLAEVVQAVWWFNPLLWLACARLRRESERACDDIVLASGIEPTTYAAHLVAVARSCRPSSAQWSAAIPMARPTSLEGRISAMLNPSIDRSPLSARIIACIVAGLLTIAVPAASLRAGQAAPPTLQGSVYDESGGVLPQVELTLEGIDAPAMTLVTDAEGRFTFPTVEPGEYVLEARLAGFLPLRQEFELRHSRDWDRAITLQVGELRETIVVRSSRSEEHQGAAQAEDAPLRVGGNIRAPRKLRDVKPVYPETMREAGREGTLALEAVVGRDGAVQSIRVLGAHVHPDFAMAAAEAVRQWQFDPTLLNGRPVEVVMTVSVAFTLGE
jgi:TonB family protein